MKSILLAAALMTSLQAFADQPDYLTDQNGMTLYTFDKDRPGESNCYDQCALSWPPYLVSDHQHTKAGWQPKWR